AGVSAPPLFRLPLVNHRPVCRPVPRRAGTGTGDGAADRDRRGQEEYPGVAFDSAPPLESAALSEGTATCSALAARFRSSKICARARCTLIPRVHDSGSSEGMGCRAKWVWTATVT